jgi:cell division protein FtsZ
LQRNWGALTVAVVTKPFLFEGKKRNSQAEGGINELRKTVDTLIIIPNQRLLSLGGRNISLLDAFRKADDILYHAVKGISDLIMIPGLINLDFADVKAIMSEMGMAMMGTGTASGENRAAEAAQKAISSPLLEDNTIQGARGVLLNITGGADMTLYEIHEASSLIQAEAHEDANIIFGTVVDETMGDEIRITVIATGFENAELPRSNVTSLGSVRRSNLAIPTYIRQEQTMDTAAQMKTGTNDPEEELNLEIPTFLRRQAD